MQMMPRGAFAFVVVPWGETERGRGTAFLGKEERGWQARGCLPPKDKTVIMVPCGVEGLWGGHAMQTSRSCIIYMGARSEESCCMRQGLAVSAIQRLFY